MKTRIINRLKKEGFKDFQIGFIINILEEEGAFKTASKAKKFTKADFRQTLLQLGCDAQHVEDWMKVRTTKKGSFTKTSLTHLINECDRNSFPISEAVRLCAENDWRGFKYEWITNTNRNGIKETEIGATANMAREVLQRAGFEY
ncbi:MAG TPA: hypothetical protein VK048_03155 [Atopostipes sp.]|nr:hypothetical protein [Atopostipes sp.]